MPAATRGEVRSLPAGPSRGREPGHGKSPRRLSPGTVDAEACPDGSEHLSRNLGDRRRTVDDDPVPGVVRGDLAETLVDSSVELRFLGFDPVWAHAGQLRLLRRPATPGDLARHVHEHGEVEPSAAGREFAGAAYLLDGQPATVALVGERRAREPVDDDVAAGGECRGSGTKAATTA